MAEELFLMVLNCLTSSNRAIKNVETWTTDASGGEVSWCAHHPQNLASLELQVLRVVGLLADMAMEAMLSGIPCGVREAQTASRTGKGPGPSGEVPCPCAGTRDGGQGEHYRKVYQQVVQWEPWLAGPPAANGSWTPEC